MADFQNQLEEIKTLLSSNTKANKPFAYSTLLHLQEQSSNNPSSIQTLAQSSHTLLSQIIADISDDDEEIAAQALKCLGFTIYHPSLVAAIPVVGSNLVVESLAELIMTTKMKSVCNLGVWCISIQQFNASFLAAHFHSLLRAVVHALENPIGSLSTTFEAIQAVIKLATLLSENMRDTSNIWAPSVYRRLISVDKRERDVSERCLMKIRPTIFPPPLHLSKVLVLDLKQKLLPGMKELLNHGMKVQAMQAWGWFIRLLGSHAMKNRHLVNEMLKVPELTFSDHDPQVRIASQVAWEGLIDALIHPPIQDCETSTALENGIQQMGTSKGNSTGTQVNGFLKSLKLIMTPLIGIMASKCDISVQSSCLNTWCYLLHKLDTSVNYPSVIRAVLEPIFEAVFRIGPENKSIWLWNICLDLLDDLISAKYRDVNYESNNQVGNVSSRATMPGKCSWKHFSIKWLPWDLSQLDFHIKIIYILVSQGSMANVSPENRSLACDAALRIFRSVLKVIQIKLKNTSINYNEIMFCLNRTIQFTKKICEDVTSEDSGINDLHHTSLRFVEAVTEELELSILGSPLYKMPVDLKYIKYLQSVNDIRHAKVLAISSIAYMDMVSPIVYLTILYFCVVVQSTFNASNLEFILQGMHKHLKFLLSSYDSLENLHAVIGLLYKHMGFSWLKIWITLARVLKDYIDNVKDLSLLKSESDSIGYFAVCQLLSHPFVVCSCSPKQLSTVKISGSPELSLVSSLRELELEHVIEVWKSLYDSVTRAPKFEGSTSNGFAEDLVSVLNGCLDESISMLESNNELGLSDEIQGGDLLSLCGNVVICILEQIMTSEKSSKGNRIKDDGFYKRSSGINILGFSARFMRLSWAKRETDPSATPVVTSRVFSALTCFVGCLYLKQDISSFIEIISSPLLQWLSHVETQNESAFHQLQLLWTETLNSLQKSQPPIVFDSSFLNLQAPLLEKTLDHPHPSISKPTITFWNNTYGEQIKLDYPQCLLPILDKLSRNGKINLHKRSPPFLEKCVSRLEVGTAAQRYRVTATHNRSSKRVELVGDTVNGFDHKDKLFLGSKRKRLELTEHQKEVRRAQQGKERDCNGHGPGIRTYTTADFSQGNDESQGSQEFRNPESILEMLRRDG
ncbi:hypothetical protein L1049_000932 [Liquidambar formosana]|uniref:Telomere-associated protein Rif1 N-terminal domain-containing protein n=1 Tax=Liquidambar formosana TaxID=63359 RepID=A0AAP0N9N5_LIQFO